MDINKLFETSVERSKRWHNGDITNWSSLEWAAAMAGEAGEACNAAKKLRRMENGMETRNEPGRHFVNTTDARAQVAREAADTILYGLLLMARVGVTNPETILRNVFNTKSEEYGFPERV